MPGTRSPRFDPISPPAVGGPFQRTSILALSGRRPGLARPTPSRTVSPASRSHPFDQDPLKSMVSAAAGRAWTQLRDANASTATRFRSGIRSPAKCGLAPPTGSPCGLMRSGGVTIFGLRRSALPGGTRRLGTVCRPEAGAPAAHYRKGPAAESLAWERVASPGRIAALTGGAPRWQLRSELCRNVGCDLTPVESAVLDEYFVGMHAGHDDTC